MEYGSLPDVSGRVSRLVMGSMVFSTENLGLTFDLLDRFVEAGGTGVDEARVYARGTSEEALSELRQQHAAEVDAQERVFEGPLGIEVDEQDRILLVDCCEH
jgi:aryl-alcohol dehydrogenase-like predicted oxidoreductase